MHDDDYKGLCAHCDVPMFGDDAVPMAGDPDTKLCAFCATEDDEATQDEVNEESERLPPSDCPECGSRLVPYMHDAWTCTECGENWTDAELEPQNEGSGARRETCDQCGDELMPGDKVTMGHMELCKRCVGDVQRQGQHNEGLSFDKHVDAILIKEGRRTVEQPETPQRLMNRKYRERPANRTRFGSR